MVHSVAATETRPLLRAWLGELINSRNVPLGQKQTCALQNVMSALPPIATAKAKFRRRPCPLYPQERTCAVQLGMSALGQKRTPTFYSITSSARASTECGIFR